MASTTPPRRRFKPEPLETTTRHSDAKSRNEAYAQSSPTSSAGTQSDGLTNKHASKRFKPEPIEQTTRSNHAALQHNNDMDLDMEDAPLLPHEKALETSNHPTNHSRPSPARRKFAVQPVETTSRTNRRDFAVNSKESDQQATPKAQSPSRASVPTDTADSTPKPPPARRKFKVEMIETAKRSRRSGDTTPAVRAEDKTNGIHSESFKSSRPPPTPLPPQNTPTTTQNAVPLAQLLKPNPNRQGSMHPHYTTRSNTRQHSFKVPSLDAIDSSESSPAHSTPARSRSSSSSSPNQDEGYKDATRMRESVDDRFSGYLLALAARAAEKQLRDQEAAVYPASDTHEPIMHYVDSEEGSEASPVASRKPSQGVRPGAAQYRRDSDDERLAMQEMRKYGDTVEREKGRDTTKIPGRGKTGAFNVEFDAEAVQGAWMSSIGVDGARSEQSQNKVPGPKPERLIGGYQKDPDLKQMRKAASPPMLGGDIDFPRCPSPDHARFDVTQGSEFLRNSMCYLSGAGQEGATGQGLWGRAGRSESKMSTASQSTNKSVGGTGLWGGHCTQSDAKVTSVATGIVTPPALDKDETSLEFPGISKPPSPPASNASNASVNITVTNTAQEAILEKEFPDTFVTQVYNYLSLGFPALARKFDPELSKISGVDVEELRADDKLAEQRGYLRLGEDEIDVSKPRSQTEKEWQDAEDEGIGGADHVVKEEMCARWRALRVYVREWGKQMGCADEGGERKRLDPSRAWGIAARKGSWGG